MSILISFLPKRPLNKLANRFPILINFLFFTFITNLSSKINNKNNNNSNNNDKNTESNKYSFCLSKIQIYQIFNKKAIHLKKKSQLKIICISCKL